MSDPIRIELPTIFGMKTVNAYLFLEPEPVLIDCGEKTEASWQALESNLRKYGLQIRDLCKVIITHAHVDHMGMAGEITRHSDAQIWVSSLAYNWAVELEAMHDQRGRFLDQVIAKVDPRTPSPIQMAFSKAFGTFRKYWDPIPKERVEVFSIDQPLHFGGRAWEVIHAPGHCSNQTCFYHQASGQLLSADMLLAKTPTPVIDVDPNQPDKRVKTILQLLHSYRYFQELEISQVFPGHFDPFGDPGRLIRQQIHRIHLRKKSCLSLIKDGIHDFPTLMAELYNNKIYPPAFPMLIGYLDLLEEENLIEVLEQDGFHTFFAT